MRKDGHSALRWNQKEQALQTFDPHPLESPAILEFQPTTKTILCGGCSKEMTVSIRTVLAYCPACSAGLGVKQ